MGVSVKHTRGLLWVSRWADAELTRYKRRLRYPQRPGCNLEQPEDDRAAALVALREAAGRILMLEDLKLSRTHGKT